MKFPSINSSIYNLKNSKNYLFQIILSASFIALSRLPIHLGFLVFFSFVPLFWFFDGEHGKKASIISGFVFSFIYTTISLHWIALVTLGGYIGMYLLFGLYFSILFLFINFFWQRLKGYRFLIIITFWIGFEYLQNYGEFSFPWFNLAYSLAEYLYLIQPAEWGGVFLLSFHILAINFLLYKFPRRIAKYSLMLLLFIWIFIGYLQYHQTNIHLKRTETTISIAQGSIPQSKKWEKSYLDSTVAIYAKLTENAVKQKSDLVIWPESAIPLYLYRNYRYKTRIQQLCKKLDVGIFIGFPDYERAPENHPSKYLFYNSCSLFDLTGKIYPPYKKNILVPFGERMPFLSLFPFLWKIDMGQANFEYGKDTRTYPINSFKFSPLICFEIAFPQLETNICQKDADFIVNLTNDAWFKRSVGTYQHAQMAIFRAIETRKQIYRAANTGISLIILPTGKILQRSKLYAKTILTGNLFMAKRKTFFTKIFPFIGFVLFGLFIIILGVYLRKLRSK